MTTPRKPYHTLCLRDDGDRRWRPEFGSYSRSEVEAERKDYARHAYLHSNAKIITTDDDQASIDTAVAELNA